LSVADFSGHERDTNEGGMATDQAEHHLGSASAAGERPTFPRKTRVLIVDDLAQNRLMLEVCCDQFGVAHESVADGREALEVAESGRFDVILMDILMPRMDGISATRAIRALPEPVGSVPIIAVTNAAAPGEVLRYLACGMTDVVSKPVNPSRLADVMSAALRPVRRSRKAAAPRAA
jgi:CheY-like chemotaxis protein